MMTTILYTFAGLLILADIFPFIKNPHWFFRIWDFGRIQLTIMRLITFLLSWYFIEERDASFYIFQALLALGIIYNLVLLIPYTPVYRLGSKKESNSTSNGITIVSVNVYQYNKEHHLLLERLKEHKPDIILTMETDKDWENSLADLEKDYPFTYKIALDNTYGMHFYSKVKARQIQAHYFVSKEIPSIEAQLETEDGYKFTLFGVHPPPPSPTEEETSIERDGELISVAKRAKKIKEPVVVVGDFNNVAWARSSVLFRKTSGLIDPRIGRGFVSTYHAKHRLFRFPIDLFFHSTNVFIEEFKTLEPVNSDHLPLYCKFFIAPADKQQEQQKEFAKGSDKQEADEMVQKAATHSDN